MTELPEATQRVADAAAALGLKLDIHIMPSSTRTAEDAAKACECDVGQIVKSLIFKGKDSGGAILLLVSGSNRVNEKTTGATIGEKITRPDAAFVREATGFAIGGIPPLGHATPIATYFDADLLRFDRVWAAAGTPHAVFPVNPADLRDKLAATVIAVA